MKVLIIVDMQNDFITGKLANPQAQKILPRVVEKINNFKKDNSDGIVIATQDTHLDNYLSTFEGKRLPTEHCIIGSKGWELCNEIKPLINGENVQVKYNIGDNNLGCFVFEKCWGYDSNIESIEMCGICTGICVISNAILLKAYFPDIPVIVDSKCCACVSKESHYKALDIMRLCQIDVI